MNTFPENRVAGALTSVTIYSDPACSVPAAVYNEASGIPLPGSQLVATTGLFPRFTANETVLYCRNNDGTVRIFHPVDIRSSDMSAADVVGRSGSLLTTGEETFDRLLVATALGTTSQRLQVTYFTARKSETITQVLTASIGAAAATPTLCRVGVYATAANGDLTALLAATPNDTTLWAAANTAYTKAFSAAFSTVAGSRYAMALLCVTGAGLPSWPGTAAGLPLLNSTTPRLAGCVTAQADLPASLVASSYNVAASPIYAALLP